MKKMLTLLMILTVSMVSFYAFALKPETQKPLAKTITSVNSNRITLELKNMDVVEVLKLLASKGDFNVVVSQNVRGRITLFLNDVPVWDAMQIVFETADLAYTENKGILRIITGREYERQFGRKFHDKRQVKIISLQYAIASDVASELKRFKSRIGNVITDDCTNSVILLDTPNSLKIMEDTIKDLDVAMQTKVFALKYTPAKSLEDTLKKLLSKKGVLHIDDLTNKVILTDIPNVISRAEKIVAEYDTSSALKTKIFTLNYGKFDDVEKKIKSMLTKDVGTIQSDERTNKIVIADLPEKIKEISRVIKAYDVPNKQVLIEAKIVQVALNDEYKMGINWQLILSKVWVDRIFNTDTIDVTLSQVFNTLSEQGTSETATFDNSNRAANPGMRTLISGTLKNGSDLDTIIDALKTAGKTNLLSSPRILAINNQEAHLKVGTREAFVTNTVVQSGDVGTTAENVTFIDVGVMLTITPTIGDNGVITLKIKPEVSNVDHTLETAQGNTIPIVATQEAETTITVKDNVTVIIGGLIEDQQYKTTDKVPILGSIPILGVPFRKEHNKIKKNELVIFLTPHIVTGNVDMNMPNSNVEKFLERLKAREEQNAGKKAKHKKLFKLAPVKKTGSIEQKAEPVSNFTHR